MIENTSWPGWQTIAKLGSGTFGTVYRIQKQGVDGHIFTSALKVISIPNERDPMLYCEDETKCTKYVNALINELVKEISLMDELKYNSHIVRFEDYQIVPHQKGIGYDVLIRMECLTPVNQYHAMQNMTVGDVLQMGLDISDALCACSRKNIIHRDIKPANIMRDDSGSYKLGDFGIARTLEEEFAELTRAGTMSYVAPEVMMGRYDARADIYSLAMVMYYYLNEQKLPFENTDLNLPTERSLARSRRMQGEAVPAPKYGSPQLKSVICKALAFRQEDRYRSAQDFYTALSQCKDRQSEISHLDETVMVGIKTNPVYQELDETLPIRPRERDSQQTIPQQNETIQRSMQSDRSMQSERYIQQPPKRGMNKVLVALSVLFAVLAFTFIALFVIKTLGKKKQTDNVMSVSSTQAGSQVSTEEEQTSQVTTEEKIPEALKKAKEYEGHYYEVINQSCSWKEAKKLCEEKGGHMVTITSHDEQLFIEKLVEEKGVMKHYWLGATDREEEGKWKWITGEKWGFTNWEEDQPNNSEREDPEHGQDYLEMQATIGDNGYDEYMTWTDIINDGTSLGNEKAPEYNSKPYYGTICEWDCVPEE